MNHLNTQPMSVDICLFVGNASEFLVPARSAALVEFPLAVVQSAENIDELLKRDSGLENTLVILDAKEVDAVRRCAEAKDISGLQRWALVVRMDHQPAEALDCVLTEDWTVPILLRSFRSAVLQHKLIRRSQRLEGDLRTLSSRISHDLRTPLGGILSVGEVLSELLTDTHPQDLGLVKPLFSSVNELKSILDRVNLLTRASSNPVVKQWVSMSEIVWSVQQRHERQILAKGAVLTQPDSWPDVFGVYPWLEAIWSNFLTNALQYGRPVPRIILSWVRDGKDFRFSVSDDGDGVPAAKLPGLFQPFHQLYHANARRGLGLSLVQRLVELQGGQCGYNFSTETGAVFFFTLPADEPAPESSSMLDLESSTPAIKP